MGEVSVDGRASYTNGVLEFIELGGVLIFDGSALEDDLMNGEGDEWMLDVCNSWGDELRRNGTIDRYKSVR